MICTVFVHVFPVRGQGFEKQNEWTGKLKDGTVITEKDLKKILEEQERYLERYEDVQKALEEGRTQTAKRLKEEADLAFRPVNFAGSDLRGADLRFSKLAGANLTNARLEAADLNGSDLSGANLTGADLRYAQLILSNLEGARFWDADLSLARLQKARLGGADLRRAKLFSADLSEADLNSANLAYSDLRNANLSSADLRKTVLLGTDLDNAILFETGFIGDGALPELHLTKLLTRQDAERLTIYYNRIIRWKRTAMDGGFYGTIKGLFNLILFDFTCQYGMAPSRPLVILLCFIPYFAVFYLFALRTKDPKTGIRLILARQRVPKPTTSVRSFKLGTKFPARPLPRGVLNWIGIKIHNLCRMIKISLYFSLLSAFNIGLREINTKNLITRLQRQDYTLRATGWARTLAGIQSLLSIYLLVLWVLTTFGNAF